MDSFALAGLRPTRPELRGPELDVAGSKWFGYPTYWNNRQNATSEQLGVTPDCTGESLIEVARFLGERSANGSRVDRICDPESPLRVGPNEILRIALQ
jgi:hypothetical protein